jgi:hypothetical protein
MKEKPECKKKSKSVGEKEMALDTLYTVMKSISNIFTSSNAIKTELEFLSEHFLAFEKVRTLFLDWDEICRKTVDSILFKYRVVEKSHGDKKT